MSTGTTSRARELVQEAGTIASPPLVYERLVAVINDPRSGSADIARVISEDQGLTARLLRVVNSAFFSLPWRVDTVSAAIRVVGTRQIRDLAVATSVVKMFKDVPDDVVDMDSFWRHSLAVGVAARVIAGHRGEDNVERFFVAGLLHDLGRLVLLTLAGAETRKAVEQARAYDEPLFRWEREVIGCSHAQVGGALLEHWNFPPALREAVRHHHQPRAASQFPKEAAAVHVGDIVAHALHWGRSGETRVPPLERRAWELLALDLGLVPTMLEDTQRQLEAAVHLVGG